MFLLLDVGCPRLIKAAGVKAVTDLDAVSLDEQGAIELGASVNRLAV
jgi:hypothetical protein